MDREKQILKLRDEVLILLKDKANDFALGGGTALSLFYFHHRESYDLDFFTKKFSETVIKKLVKELSIALGKAIRILSEFEASGKAKVIVFEVAGGLKIDFIEDVFRHFEVKSTVNGIPILSKESIYIRKIYAACGIVEKKTSTGHQVFVGGRQEAKDYFDLYVLSNTFMPLSQFVKRFCDLSERERIIIWFRRYERMAMMSGLMDIRTDLTLDAKAMERHFSSEIESIIGSEIN
jgi:hypothetical protein